MKNRAVQQKDLAKMLNVSVMTISKALRDHPDISESMRKKIKELAQNLGYRPNLVARNLCAQKTNTLGIVMPRIAHSFYSRILDGIYREAKQKGYSVILTVSQEDCRREEENIQNLLAMRVDGLLVSVSQSTQNDQSIHEAQRAKVPLVFFDRVLPLSSCSQVSTDNYGGAFAAIQWAIQAGYRRIAHLCGFAHLQHSRLRRDGCLDALQKARLPVRPEWILETRFGEEGGAESFHHLWKQAEKPELIFTVSDSVALGVYKAAREYGLRIPEDIGVIGFSDIEFASLLSPPLTTVREPAEELGKQAASLLIEEIENEQNCHPQQRILPTQLIVRQSCRTAPTPSKPV